MRQLLKWFVMTLMCGGGGGGNNNNFLSIYWAMTMRYLYCICYSYPTRAAVSSSNDASDRMIGLE